MPEPHNFDDDEIPMLTEVVQRGNEERIEAARNAQLEIERAVGTPRSRSAPLTPAQISRSITSPTAETFDSPPFSTRGGTQLPFSESQLEQLIDEIVERHAEQMRNELHTILKHRG